MELSRIAIRGIAYERPIHTRGLFTLPDCWEIFHALLNILPKSKPVDEAGSSPREGGLGLSKIDRHVAIALTEE